MQLIADILDLDGSTLEPFDTIVLRRRGSLLVTLDKVEKPHPGCHHLIQSTSQGADATDLAKGLSQTLWLDVACLVIARQT